MDEAIVSSKLQEMIESAAANIPVSIKKFNKRQSVDKPIFIVSKKDMKKFLDKELVISKSTGEGGTMYEEIDANSEEFLFRACKTFQFHVYEGKRISKKKRAATGTAAGGTAGGVAGGVAGGCAGGVGGMFLGGLAGAILGTLIFPIVGTVIGGIGGAMVGGASGAAAGGAAGAGAGAGAGMLIGAAAGATNADYKKKKKAVIMTAKDIFRCGGGYREDEKYVYCTVTVTPPSGDQVDVTAW